MRRRKKWKSRNQFGTPEPRPAHLCSGPAKPEASTINPAHLAAIEGIQIADEERLAHSYLSVDADEKTTTLRMSRMFLGRLD